VDRPSGVLCIVCRKGYALKVIMIHAGRHNHPDKIAPKSNYKKQARAFKRSGPRRSQERDESTDPSSGPDDSPCEVIDTVTLSRKRAPPREPGRATFLIGLAVPCAV